MWKSKKGKEIGKSNLGRFYFISLKKKKTLRNT